MMVPAQMREEAEAFVRRCVDGIPCSEDEILRASEAAFVAFTWRIDAIRRSGINGLFDEAGEQETRDGLATD